MEYSLDEMNRIKSTKVFVIDKEIETDKKGRSNRANAETVQE